MDDLGISPEKTRQLALTLLYADSEVDVRKILQEHGLWEDDALWRPYGDREGNYATIGNQQSKPEAALVEKLVNSVDARLMDACFEAGLDPRSEDAPQSIREAVAAFIQGVDPSDPMAGLLRLWDSARQREQARMITLAATGSKAREETMPCLTIADQGEGQTPESMPETFLSIDKENKLRIPFVQGKFNMGGTGALDFCGTDGIQLIITRRTPHAPKEDGDRSDEWGVTIVRRKRPTPGAGEVRNSLFQYLAPLGATERPNRGSVMSFPALSIPVLPEQDKAYALPLEYGSVVKLYEYAMRGFQSHILFDLRQRLELLLPAIALPIRMHECRGYSGSEGSFENTLVGLSARLEANRGDNLEEGFPTSTQLRVRGEELGVEIFAFRKDPTPKAKPRAKSYRRNEGLIFTINGQTHGSLSARFFGRNKVKLGRLADSLLVVIDCSKISVGGREDLFMNSRDRLREGDLKSAIEAELEDLLRSHSGLKELAARRKREEVEQRLDDSKPLQEVLGSIMKNSPTLNRLFLLGERLSRPHKQGTVSRKHGDKEIFKGKPHPTFFRFKGKDYGTEYRRNSEAGRRSRIAFETDVVNDYFTRESIPGEYRAEVIEGGLATDDLDHSLTLHNGTAQWSVSLPDDLEPGDEVVLQCTVADVTLVEPFVNVARISIVPERERTKRDDKDSKAGIKLPQVVKVQEGTKVWTDRDFDAYTATQVEDDLVSNGGSEEPESELTFYVNVSNRYLETEIKESGEDAALCQAKFVFGNVLIGLALMNDAKNNGEGGAAEKTGDSEKILPQEQVEATTRALAPFLIPMIDHLGSLSEEEVSEFSVADD